LPPKPTDGGQGAPERIGAPRLVAHAMLLGERIDTAALERRDAISTAPLALRVKGGLVVIYRYGVVVTAGLDGSGEQEVLREVLPCVHEPLVAPEEETVELSAREDQDEGVGVDGVVRLGTLDLAKLLIVADALAKSTVLEHDERHMAEVFDTLEPWAQQLAAGLRPGSRRAMIRLIGQALLVQHRLTERVGVREKPDILWDRPDLERLYVRLENEYELTERAEALDRKLELVGETVTVMTDLIDTQRSLRLEAIIVVLILGELALSIFQILWR
jgi:uncharacterized Rmd1/YagE family protein